MSNIFEKAVASKTTEELKWITENPREFQNDFLIAVQNELRVRDIEIESDVFVEKINRLEAANLQANKIRKALEQLPNTIKSAANLIYLGLAMRLLGVFNYTFRIQIGVGEFPYINLVGGFLLMIYIAAVIKKGHDIRKLLLLIVVLNSLSFLFSGLPALTEDISLSFSISAMSVFSELVAIILLYHDDSRDWYANLKD